MNGRFLGTVVTALIVIAQGGTGSAQQQAAVQQLPNCDQRIVVYTPFDESLAPRMQAQPGPVSVINMGEKQFSPQKTSWLTITHPDFSKPGPWDSQAFIHFAGRRTPELINFKDHASGGVTLQWLNEKLIYGSVWWGRIASTDFIFDVEKNAFLYREMANYGNLGEPCQP